MHLIHLSGLQVRPRFYGPQVGYPIADLLLLGHLLTKKEIVEILKQHGVPHKVRDKKEIIVEIYTRFIKSKPQVKTASISTPVKTASISTPVPSTSMPSGPPCKFARYSIDELQQLLEPFSLKTASLSKAELILLCKAYFNRSKRFKWWFQLAVYVLSPSPNPQINPSSFEAIPVCKKAWEYLVLTQVRK